MSVNTYKSLRQKLGNAITIGNMDLSIDETYVDRKTKHDNKLNTSKSIRFAIYLYIALSFLRGEEGLQGKGIYKIIVTTVKSYACISLKNLKN